MVHSEKMAGLYLLYGHYFGLQHSLKDYMKPWKKWRRKNLWDFSKKNLIVLALIKGTFWSLSGSFYYGASKGSKSHLSVGNIWLILSIPGSRAASQLVQMAETRQKWNQNKSGKLTDYTHSWVWQILIMKHMQKETLA